MTCRNCKFLIVPLDKAGRRVVRSSYVYKCGAPLPEIKLPDSITKYYGWKWPPSRNSMTSDDGENCPTFEPRIKL